MPFPFEQCIENDRRRNNSAGLEATAGPVFTMKLHVEAEKQDKWNEQPPDHSLDQVMSQANLDSGPLPSGERNTRPEPSRNNTPDAGRQHDKHFAKRIVATVCCPGLP